jgi:hypothetical protein
VVPLESPEQGHSSLKDLKILDFNLEFFLSELLNTEIDISDPLFTWEISWYGYGIASSYWLCNFQYKIRQRTALTIL